MNEQYSLHEPLILGNKNRSDVTQDVTTGIKTKTQFWRLSFTFSILLLALGGYCLYRTWWDGIGMWGEDTSVNWAWDITNFVWLDRHRSCRHVDICHPSSIQSSLAKLNQ